MANTDCRTICAECRSILYLLYLEWETTELNSICPTDYNLPALAISAQQCPLCELFLTDFHSHNFPDVDVQEWSSKTLVASPLRWPNTDLRGMRLEVQDSKKVQNIIEVASIHLFKPTDIPSISLFQYAQQFSDFCRSYRS